MQVDWTSGIVTAPAHLAPGYDTGLDLRLGPGGVEVRRSPGLVNVRDEDPSSSRTIAVKCLSPGSLWVSGNPVKLLQDHNLWGSCDALGLFLEAGVWVRRRAGLFPGPETWRGAEFSGPRWTRLDLTRSYRFPTPDAARRWILGVAAISRSRHGAPKLYDSGTAAWGQGSRRWMFKVYDKRQELIYQASRRGKSATPPDDTLLDWAGGVVRFELQLRSPELERMPEQVAALAGPDARAAALAIWEGYRDRINWNQNAAMARDTTADAALPTHLALKLGAWRGGSDLRAMMTRATFYRVRRQILDAVAVDIAQPAPSLSAASADTAGGTLDPAGWDPEPLAAAVEPRGELVHRYGFGSPAP